MADLIANSERLRSVRLKLNSTLRPYASRFEFEAATIAPEVTMVRVIVENGVYQLVRDAGGDWISRDGGKWRADELAAVAADELARLRQDSQDARDKSAAFAEKPEDDPVVPGPSPEYSSRHWAAKAAKEKDAAQAAKDIAQSRTDIVVQAVDALAALTYADTGLTVGKRVTVPGVGVYEVLASDAAAADIDHTGAGGIKLRQVRQTAVMAAPAFGARGNLIVNDTAALLAALNAGGRMTIPTGDYLWTSNLAMVRSNTHLSFAKDAFLMPPATGAASALRIEGAEPSSWVALAADAAEGSASVPLASVPPGAVAGGYLELRSNAPIPGTNSQGGKIAQVLRITGVSGTTIHLDRPLYYDFLMADGATAGVPTMVENVYLECPNVNRIDYVNPCKWSLYLRYCARVTVIAPNIYGVSKARNGADAGEGVNAIQVSHGALDVTIFDPSIGHCGWYGISVGGFNDGLNINLGTIWDCRHAISVVYSANYGEVWNMSAKGVTGRETNLSVFDSHDTGQGLLWDTCRAYGSRGDSGFQIRSRRVRLLACTAAHNLFEGMVCRSDGTDVQIEQPDVYANGRTGISALMGHTIMGGSVRGNASYALTSSGGRVVGTELLTKGAGASEQVISFGQAVSPGVNQPLILDAIKAPAQVSGNWLVHANNSGRDPQDVRISNSDIPGYGGNLYRGDTVGAGNLGPSRSNNRSNSVAPLKGRVTLVSGAAAVVTAAVVNRAADPAWVSEIVLRRAAPGGTVGAIYVASRTHNSGFEIASTDAADTSVVEWEIVG